MNKEQKNYINQQIKTYYSTEDSIQLAHRLGISLSYLRVRAKRLHCRRGSRTITNEIIDGMKLCPNCGEIKPIQEFNKDKYQPNRIDYWCRCCRHKSTEKKKTEKNNKINKDKVSQNGSMSFGIKKTHNNIIKVLDENGNLVDGLKCKGNFCNNSKKPLSEFYSDSGNINGVKNICKYCLKMRRELNKKGCVLK